jgi:hypothetical protein
MFLKTLEVCASAIVIVFTATVITVVIKSLWKGGK